MGLGVLKWRTSMKKGGVAKGMANVILFLASDAASFLTEKTIAIDGGGLS